MRRAAVMLAAGFAGMLLFGLIGRAVDSQFLYFLAGLSFVAALWGGLALLPVWDRLGLRLPAMTGLFRRPGPGEAWSPVAGKPVAKEPPAAKPSARPGAPRRGAK